MHNSFLACVLSYHNLKWENTSTFSHSEIMWPKVYLIPLLPQKRNSLVKGWIVRVLEILRFPFTTQLHQLQQPCLLPDAWSHKPTAAHKRHRRLARAQLLDQTQPHLCSGCWSTPLAGNPVKHVQNGEQSVCQEAESARTGGSTVRSHESFAKLCFEGDLQLESPLGANSS